MSAGATAAVRLTRQLELQERTSVADGAGGAHAQWQTLGTLWAAIDAGSGREGGALGISRSAVPMKITVRAAPVGSQRRPRPDQRFAEGARIYKITAVAEAGSGARYLTCYAVEEVAV